MAPDVVLMDVRMPRVNGIEAARRIRDGPARAPGSWMLTVSDEEDDLYEAIKAGGPTATCSRRSPWEEVASAIHSVVQGQSLISPSYGFQAVEASSMPWPA